MLAIRKCLNDIQEMRILEKFIELEELLILDKMIEEYSETHLHKLRIRVQKETMRYLIHNEDHIHTILHFWTNIICFIILSSYYILGSEELNDQIISGLVSTFPVILDTIFKYCSFHYLNRVSLSLVVIYHSMND
ncbi:hypothetical protein M9H77_16129 [Catharanthus roseus]|uniref:Uncharacterized protein n=1 Tax=Catharanthus roseus TaxID=4058 RepID=A0ACC0B027_CATRO|nr:hypothetical protein M9H77_16129 [Catharanthus roseus]